MQINLMGLIFETPCVVVHLYSPWRASALENKLFENIRQIPGVVLEQAQDELIIPIRDLKTWKIALAACVRSLKGWQEDAPLPCRGPDPLVALHHDRQVHVGKVLVTLLW